MCCMYGKATYIKVNQLRYDSFSQNIKVHQARYSLILMASVFSLCGFSRSPTWRVSLEMQASGIHISF